jgi:hypothetical protein
MAMEVGLYIHFMGIASNIKCIEIDCVTEALYSCCSTR